MYIGTFGIDKNIQK